MEKRVFLKTGLLGLGALAFTRKAAALEYYPKESTKKWAVLYGTWCGSSRDAAVWISEGMDGIANVFDVRENPDLSTYDCLVVGGSIRAGQTTAALQEYLTLHQDKMKDKIRGLFAVCGNRMQAPGPEQTAALIDNHLAMLCGVTGLPSKVLLGRITYGLLDPDSRKMMEGMNMPEYDNLKREACMSFGKEVLAAAG